MAERRRANRRQSSGSTKFQPGIDPLVRAARTVTWAGSLAAHPLAPGNPDNPNTIGTLPSPIEETSSGQMVEFTFTSAGTFPHYCEIHSFGNGMGMAGVVHVEPAP